MIEFLRNNFDTDYQLQASGTVLTIKEGARNAKLKEVGLDLPDPDNYFAFVMDRKKIKRCDNSSCGQVRRNKCNDLHSKVCNFLHFEQGLHKGCDAVIVTCEGKNVFFTICDLKSKNPADCRRKFEMGKALAAYLFEAAAVQDYQVFLQFIVFKMDEGGSHHPRTADVKESGRIIPSKDIPDKLKYSTLVFSAHEIKTKPKVSLKRLQEDKGHFYTCSWTCSHKP